MDKNSVTSLSDLSVERPVLATVMSLIIVLAGIISFSNLPVREFPDIDPPVVTVTTVYPGANAKVIETEITDILEQELIGVEGIRTMTSTSRDQVSSVVIEFVLERGIDVAAQDVRDKISRVSSRLPENADQPVIAKADSDAQPIIWVRVQSDTRDMLSLSDYTDRELKDYFQNISGVSKVVFAGERKKSIQIFVDPQRLAYFNLTILELRDILSRNNIELPAGRILSKNKEFSINVNAKITEIKEYENLIVKQSADGIGEVHLKDIADVKIAAENDRSFIRFNGNQGFGLGIVRQSKSNALQISDDVNKVLAELSTRIPKDIELDIGYDSSQFIRTSLNELYSTLIQATLLVLLVIFVFLRNIRSTLIPGLAIPISLIGVMAGIQLFGFTINQMTLLGLIIAIGIVVDDSIIVLENIYRQIEEGLEPKEAAKKGAKEITLAVIATTAVLVSIFLPIAFLKGITGRLLSEFAFSLCFATIISSFVALTLAPMMCSKVFRSKAKRELDEAGKKKTFYKKILEFLERRFVALENVYERTLEKVLKVGKTFTLVVLAISVPLMVFLFMTLPKDFIPDEDRGTFFVILQSPRGGSLELMDKQVRKVENLLARIAEMKTTISVAAFGLDAPGKVTSGIVIARLVDWDKRSRKVAGIVGPLYPQFFSMPEAFTLPIVPKSGPSSGFGAQPIQLVIKSNDLDFLIKASNDITQRALSLPTLLFAKSNLSLDKPELTVEINREKAQNLGIDMADISKSVELLFAGVDVTEFNDNGEKYEVFLKLARSNKEHIRNIGEFAVKTRDGALVQLSNIITVKESVGAEELSHYNRKKAITIQASPKAGITPSEGLQELEKSVRDYLSEIEDKPLDVEIDYLGASKESRDSNSALYFGFAVALLFAYLFLAAQFESFVSPLIIMLTVPLALMGALLGLWFYQLFPIITQTLIGILGPKFFFLQYVIPQFTNISLNIYSQVGMIMLIGLSTKNGILMVEFIDQLRAQGMKIEEAVSKAAKLRLRPILMTAISTILGLLPIALALGVGTESRQSLGVVIIFGMTISTVLTLFLIPAVMRIVYNSEGRD
jgi:multidrug efflux pump